jgi:carbamoyl-phosphate synthase small subunit
MPNAVLALEDGSHWFGDAFGAAVPSDGEVVFNTSMTGYQEISTDASYAGQMVVLTHPQIGNYGVSSSAAESNRPWIEALVVRELSATYHHWEASESLDAYLRRSGVPGISGVDTRALVKRLRARGALRAVLRQRDGDWSRAELDVLTAQAKAVTLLSEKPLVATSSGHVSLRASGEDSARGPTIAVVDCGAKANIVRSLERRGTDVLLLPWDVSVEELLGSHPDGVLLTNGPGDPAQLPTLVELAKRLVDKQVPLFGICLGHQVLGQAAGSTTSRLPYGHHGGNHPVLEQSTGSVTVTTQNHEFQVDRSPALERNGFKVSHVNLNDGSVEGLEHVELPIFSLQYHPEGCPGPQDSQAIFDRFLNVVAARAVGSEA